MNNQGQKNPIGIMQGRLSPPAGGRIQSFPVDTWREEFSLAREAGLDCIEWVYEKGTEMMNPLQTDAGVAEILRQAEDSGVAVWSVCADYFMAERLISRDGTPRDASIQHLIWLIGRAGILGANYIVLPFVDESSLQSPQDIGSLSNVLRAAALVAQRAGVELHLETDLTPGDLVALLERVAHPSVRAEYDIGNSAALGHDPEEELTLLKPWLGSVHVKDRVLGGGTVPLGTGAADFPTCFRLIRAADSRFPFILQAAREEGLSEIELAIRNRHFIEEHLSIVIK